MDYKNILFIWLRIAYDIGIVTDKNKKLINKVRYYMIKSLPENDNYNLEQGSCISGPYEAAQSLLEADIIKRCIELCDELISSKDGLEALDEV